MKEAIMSDAHANPHALESALWDARVNGCAGFKFLGDVTGYGYDVRSTLALVRKNFDLVLMGNHDAVCVGMDRRRSVLSNRHYDIDRAQAAQLTDEECEWICGLPMIGTGKGVAYVHGDFTNPKGWEYMMEQDDVRRNLAVRSERILFCGHTHAAVVWESDPSGRVRALAANDSPMGGRDDGLVVKIQDDCRYIVNCGSVGCPRNGLMGEYAIYDDEAKTATIRRLPFDLADYVREMAAHGLEVPHWATEDA